MANIVRSALLSYSAEQMYALVDDIEAYPQYMSNCESVEILARNEADVTARLNLIGKGIRHSLTTCNQLFPPHRMELTLVEGPFSAFKGCWSFDALNEEACKVSLALEFTMKSKLASFAAKALFERLADELVDAMCQRAKHVYG